MSSKLYIVLVLCCEPWQGSNYGTFLTCKKVVASTCARPLKLQETLEPQTKAGTAAMGLTHRIIQEVSFNKKLQAQAKCQAY